MPRFVALPTVIEAHQHKGGQPPGDFALAVRRHLPGGRFEVATGDGPRVCGYLDWITRGGDGQFSVVPAATFEALYTPWEPPAQPLEERSRTLHLKGSR